MNLRSKLANLLFFIFMMCLSLSAQKPERLSSSEIHAAIKKLNVLGSVLYIAAHPDDENTRLITYLSNHLQVETTYLSLTRGDGGQNLIGTEIEELLGVIRTHELLAARRTDGGKQLFTRANDFGFSKHPDETMKIWNRNDVLSDVVYAIRKVQPDIIINRFDHNSAGRTHGHHTASAILGLEAFEHSGNKNAYPEQLNTVEPWKARRLFFNTSWFFYGSRERFEQADKSNLVSIDVGVYYPLLGISNNEVAADSRSMHKSQGFGSIGSRGEQNEYLDLLKGDPLTNRSDLFADINTSWSRVPGGAPIGDLINRIAAEFRHDAPYTSVPALIKAYGMMGNLPEGKWKHVKMQETKRVIEACMGLFAEATANSYSSTPGHKVSLNIEIINRSPVSCLLQAVKLAPSAKDTVLQTELKNNQSLYWTTQFQLPEDVPYTSPYWLDKNWETGMYKVDDQKLRDLPETPKMVKVLFSLLIQGEPFTIEREVVYKFEHDVKGEVYRPFEVTPPVFVNMEEEVYVFGSDAPQTVNVLVTAGAADVSGTLKLQHPSGWRSEPVSIPFQIKLKGQKQTLSFKIFPPAANADGTLNPVATVGGKEFNKSLTTLDYEHIPFQTVLLNSTARIAKVSLKRAGNKIGYIMGAGDKVPESLRQIGYSVDILDDKNINLPKLQTYDAIVLGVRLYNTNENMKFHQPVLFEYVKNGGTLVVQYNTSSSLTLPMDEISPFKLRISRDRVTEEDSEVRFLAPNHFLLNFPNKITSDDFKGWIQERGLYYPGEWGPELTPVISTNDTGETPKDGSLLIAAYGKGYYIYTGLSFFRELPSGVPGAFRLFANLLAAGKQNKVRK
jgi:LmbE family N-acetylglucosaminyl deacetylase